MGRRSTHDAEERIRKLTYMVEGDFFECFWPILHLLMKWLQSSKHSWNIVLTKIQPRQQIEATSSVLRDATHKKVMPRYYLLRRMGAVKMSDKNPAYLLLLSLTNLDASSSPSCHCSCQSMATLMSSSETMMACWTRALLCSLMFFSIISAASFLVVLWLFVATVRGYIRA